MTFKTLSQLLIAHVTSVNEQEQTKATQSVQGYETATGCVPKAV